MKPHLFSSLVLSALLALVGCQHLEHGVPQEVTIVSSPSEASVYINGDATGITPLTIKLPRKESHEVRLEKKGYNPSVRYITPVENEKNENFIRFGLSRDLGYYVDLDPASLNEEMKSELVPASIGPDPFERMAERALEADRQLESGEISPKEHKQIIEQILQFFEENQ